MVVYKPTDCGTIFLNDGAQAILLDENGDPVLWFFGWFTNSTGFNSPLPVIADDSGPFNCDGDLKS